MRTLVRSTVGDGYRYRSRTHERSPFRPERRRSSPGQWICLGRDRSDTAVDVAREASYLEHLVVLAGYLLVTLLMTYPVALSLTSLDPHRSSDQGVVPGRR
jgi:hypothetical protein